MLYQLKLHILLMQTLRLQLHTPVQTKSEELHPRALQVSDLLNKQNKPFGSNDNPFFTNWQVVHMWLMCLSFNSPAPRYLHGRDLHSLFFPLLQHVSVMSSPQPACQNFLHEPQSSIASCTNPHTKTLVLQSGEQPHVNLSNHPAYQGQKVVKSPINML